MNPNKSFCYEIFGNVRFSCMRAKGVDSKNRIFFGLFPFNTAPRFWLTREAPKVRRASKSLATN